MPPAQRAERLERALRHLLACHRRHGPGARRRAKALGGRAEDLPHALARRALHAEGVPERAATRAPFAMQPLRLHERWDDVNDVLGVAPNPICLATTIAAAIDQHLKLSVRGHVRDDEAMKAPSVHRRRAKAQADGSRPHLQHSAQLHDLLAACRRAKDLISEPSARDLKSHERPGSRLCALDGRGLRPQQHLDAIAGAIA
mmetsp:Transcript_78322/g.227219  ORF Transcript_78322/g.227219 Transcript_78322/m.227219 type:complete len:201 (+) Transcript_78322:1658-2260(+)